MGQKVKKAKMANRAKTQVEPKLPEGTHRHRCTDCGEFWLHNEPKCINVLLCYMPCTVCSSKIALASKNTWIQDPDFPLEFSPRSGVVEGDEK